MEDKSDKKIAPKFLQTAASQGKKAECPKELMGKMSPKWDEHYWDGKSNVFLLRSALVQKYREENEYALSTAKEGVSDVPTGAIAVATLDFLPVLFATLGVSVAAMIYNSKKTTGSEFDDLLQIDSEFRLGKQSKEITREESERLLDIRIMQANIKLTDIAPTTPEEYHEYLPEFKKIAMKRGHIPYPKVSSKDVEAAGDSLKSIGKKHGKVIAENLLLPIKFAQFVAQATVGCVKDLGKPKALFVDIRDGAKTVFATAKERKHKEKSKHQRNKSQEKINHFEEHEETILKNDLMHSSIDLNEVWQAKKVFENVEEYEKNQRPALLNYSLSTSLIGIATTDLGIKTVEAITTGITAQSTEMVSDYLQDNWAGMFANAWGIVMGLGAWASTGKITHNNYLALHSEKVEEARHHEALVGHYDILLEIAREQQNKNENDGGENSNLKENSPV